MNDEHDDWWSLDDGLTSSRRAVFSRQPRPLCTEGAPEPDINARIWSTVRWVSLEALEDTGPEEPEKLAATGTGAHPLLS